MEAKKVQGKNKGKVMLYTLSTCIWCRKVKDLLGQLGVEYSYVEVDLLEESEKSKAVDTIKKWMRLSQMKSIRPTKPKKFSK